jgi:hypothetical protein
MQNRTVLLSAAVCLALAAACGSNRQGFDDTKNNPNGPGGPGEIAPAGSELVVQPELKEATIVEGQPTVIDYTATLKLPDGSTSDVTQETKFEEEGAFLGVVLGTFNGARFTAAGNRVGRSTILGSARGLQARATLVLKTEKIVIGPGADQSAPSKFGGTEDPGAAPDWAYPDSGIIVPPNMNELEFQFKPRPSQNLFELTFDSPVLKLRVFFGCQTVGAGCGYTPDKTVWDLISSAGRDQDPLKYTLRAVNSTAPAKFGKAGPREIAFTKEDLTGGIYYWNAGAGSTRRYEFGVSGQKAEAYLDQASGKAGVCVGCHVLSRDGSRIAFGIDIPGGSYRVYTVSTKSELYNSPGSNFFSFSPDSQQILVSAGSNISLRNAATGAAITDPLVPSGTMPDWSPDGKTIVYAKTQTPLPIGGNPGVDSAGLEVIRNYNGTWSGGQSIVPFAGKNKFYPSFSPDSAWILFNASPSNQSSFDAKDAEVWVTDARGGYSPIKLALASTGGDSWPKWSPVEHTWRGKKIFWLTFSSRRDYGLHPHATTQDNNGNAVKVAQLWMVGFDPEKAAAGQDPSFPAFWLPFQEPDSGNHIAQWVTKVDRMPCSGSCPSGEQCVNGRCVPIK